MYVRTEANSGKVKRIRNDGRVLLAPATARGKRIGPESEARVRILGPGEEDLAEKTMELLGRKYKTTPIVNLLTRNHERAVLEISPIGPDLRRVAAAEIPLRFVRPVPPAADA